MRKTAVAALVSVAALVVPAVGMAVPEASTRAAPSRLVAVGQASVTWTPGVVTRLSNPELVQVRVQYQCRNDARYQHYLVARVFQQRPGAPEVSYVYGYRNDVGGLKGARCTGRPVTQVLRFERSSNGAVVHPDLYLQRGAANLEFSVERRNAQGQGPGWYELHSTNQVTRRVTAVGP